MSGRDFSDLTSTLKDIESAAQKNEPQFRRRNDGSIVANSINNIESILDNDMNLKGVLGFNRFSQEANIVNPFEISGIDIKEGVIDDSFSSVLASYIESNYGVLFNERLLRHAVVNVSLRNPFNKVEDYLLEAESNWDGVSRIDDFFTKYLGVNKTKASVLIARKWFIGSVGVVLEDKFKMDYVLDLVGDGGTGKSTVLEKLSNGFYINDFPNFSSKDGYSLALRSWIANDDEMAATNNTSDAELKRFVTSKVLNFRPPYGHTDKEYIRHYTLARTGNYIQYLVDRTGNRRFLPLKADKRKQLVHPVAGLNKDEVDLIWGEAVNLFRKYGNTDIFSFTQSEELIIEEHRQEFIYLNDFETSIIDYLENKKGFVATRELAREVFDEQNIARNRKLSKSIKNFMESLSGEWKESSSYPNGKKTRGYRRIDERKD